MSCFAQWQNRHALLRSTTQVGLIIAGLLLLLGCGGAESNFQPNMDDFSYGGRRGKSLGTSASGQAVELKQFAGGFVWIDYSAPWCGPCVRQAPIIHRLEQAYGNKVTFVTVITSDMDPTTPSSRHTARVWANRFNLDPEEVVAGSEGQRFIPTHGVFSPLGQTLYWQSGWQSEDQIRATLQLLMREWDVWYAQNKHSTSVLLSEIGD